jgi:hypothetical protein
VPHVAKPLDVTKYEQNSCTVITSTQAVQVDNLTVIEASVPGVGGLPICGWRDADHSSVSFSFVRGQGGISAAYQYQDSQSGYFKVAPNIAGYPAVFTGPSDSRSQGGCTMHVGVSDDEVMVISALLRPSSPAYSDSCSITQKAAEAAMATLTGGA